MPVTKAAAKAAKRSEKLRAKNRPIKEAMKDSVKTVIKTKEKGDSIPADMVSIAYSKIDKALKAGILKKKTAARRKAKVAKIANK
jgi:small subunit ribosomal protein S20